jgi:hypothetical protein
MKESGRFVIQRHTRGGDVHWDLMLEAEEALETYRLNLSPERLTREKCPAVKIFEHRLKFLTYEGPVNKGEGNVEITESGTFKVIEQRQDYIEMEMEGEVLRGRFALKYIRDDEFLFGAT